MERTRKNAMSAAWRIDVIHGVSAILLVWRSRALSGYLAKFAENLETGSPTTENVSAILLLRRSRTHSDYLMKFADLPGIATS